MCGWQLDIGNVGGALCLLVDAAADCWLARYELCASERLTTVGRPVTTAAWQSSLQTARVNHSRRSVHSAGTLRNHATATTTDSATTANRASFREDASDSKIRCTNP